MTPRRHIIVTDWGETGYREAWERQTVLFRQTIDRKLYNRHVPIEETKPVDNYLIFCSHPPVITQGKSGKAAHLLYTEAALAEKGVQYIRTNRGGDITFHGPGQIVGYPILDLHQFFTDIHKYMRLLEEVIIRTIAEYGLKGQRLEEATGVWLDPYDNKRARKICAMGVRSSRWVTMHGFALNVNTDLSYFDYIIPCGIQDKAVTSLAAELGYPVNETDVKAHLVRHFETVFEAKMKVTTASV